MIILIYGSNGWIGKQFCQYLDSIRVNYIKGNSRVSNVQELTAEIDTINPTHIVSFIGRTSGTYNNEYINTIDYLEKPGNLVVNINDNLFSPMVLAILTNERNIHFTYLGTGCIFDYSDPNNTDEMWDENDLPNFFGSSYSIVKGYTDRLMHLFKNVLNLRIRMPITDKLDQKNFLSKILKYDKICSIPNSMTVLADFYPFWYKLITESKTGTYNCTNPGIISHNEILSMYKEIVNPAFIWTNFTIEEQNKILASKRSNNHLSTEKLSSDFPDIHDSVRKIMYKLKSTIEK
jgi:dTDP-4-dehydrorhamnose reductase